MHVFEQFSQLCQGYPRAFRIACGICRFNGVEEFLNFVNATQGTFASAAAVLFGVAFLSIAAKFFGIGINGKIIAFKECIDFAFGGAAGNAFA